MARRPGYALFFPTFSTFLTSPGSGSRTCSCVPAHRGAGVGRALLSAVAARVRERGGERLEWAALDWNELALGFYRRHRREHDGASGSPTGWTAQRWSAWRRARTSPPRSTRERAAALAPVARARDLLHEPADRRPGLDDRQRRAALDRARAAHADLGIAVDRRRLHARARQPADALRLDGRPVRAPARVRDRARAVHARRRCCAAPRRARAG